MGKTWQQDGHAALCLAGKKGDWMKSLDNLPSGQRGRCDIFGDAHAVTKHETFPGEIWTNTDYPR